MIIRRKVTMKKKLSEKDAPKFIVVKECVKKVIYEQLEIKYPPTF